MEFPKGYAQERGNYRTNESERKAFYYLREFFKDIYTQVVSGVTLLLFGKSTAAGTDKYQFDNSLQVSGEATTPRIDLLLVRGTYEAPTAIQSGDNIGALSAVGYGTSAYYTGGSVVFTATENWTNSARGTKLGFYTTPTGTTTYEESGHISAGGSWATGKPNLATNATKGFLYVPFTNGVPTGTPETVTGRYPIVIGETAGGTKTPYYWDEDALDWSTFGGATSGSFTPTISAIGGITTASGTIYYTYVGDRIVWNGTINITTNGPGNTFITLAGFPESCTDGRGALHGHDLGAAVAHNGYVNGTTAYVFKYDGTYPGYSGLELYVAGSYKYS